MSIGKIGLAISAPTFLAAATVGVQAADIAYPIEDPVLAPVPMALIGDLKLGIGFRSESHEGGIVILDDDDDSFVDVLGEGRVNIPMQGNMNLQLDLGGYGAMDDGYGLGSASFQGHLWHKRENLAYGLLGGLAFPGFGPVMWSIGAEAEHYYGNTTLGAYATYSFGSVDGWDVSAFRVAGYVEHYLTPDHKVGLELDYTAFNDEGDADQWGVVLSGEKRVSGTPYSYWIEGGYSNWSGSAGPFNLETSSWGLMTGVRIALGGTPGMTLQEHDRQLPWENLGQGPRSGGILPAAKN